MKLSYFDFVYVHSAFLSLPIFINSMFIASTISFKGLKFTLPDQEDWLEI